MSEYDNIKNLENEEGVEFEFGEIPNKRDALKHFDKVIPPFELIISKEKQKDYGGIQSLYPTKFDGKPNNIRYYTKNKKLNSNQCRVLYNHEEWRSTHGFTINDKPLEGKTLSSYIEWLMDNIHSKEEAEEETYKSISKPFKTNPDGSRSPMVIQMGMNSYMERNKIKNPVEIIDTHIKKEKLKIYDGINLGGVLGELNITPQEAFNYICSYLSKNKDIKRIHTQDRELVRGATALKTLIDFFNAEQERTRLAKKKDRKIKIYSYRDLMKSKQYSDYCIQANEVQMRSYDTFKNWFGKRLDAVAKLNKK